MTTTTGWLENKPNRDPPVPSTRAGEVSASSPPAPSANTAASGGDARRAAPSAAAALRPTINFRCQLAQRLRETVGARSNRFVATVTGYNEETVRRYLRDGGPSAEFLAAVCREFGVSADWLLLGIGPMRPEGVVPTAGRTAGHGHDEHDG